MDKVHKKTILILSCFYDPFEGGAERYVKEITQRLKEKYNFLILTSRFSRRLPEKENKDGVEILRLGFGFKFDKFLYPILAFLKSFFTKKDLIQAVLESYAGLALFFYRTFDKKTPVLLTLQSGRVSMPEFLFKKIHLAPDKIQAISTALAERAKKFGAKNVEVIPNGIDLGGFKNLDRQKSREKLALKDKFVIMTVARLEKVKGMEYLIRAMSNVECQMSNVYCLIIGDGSERKNLENLVEKLNLNEKIKFLGWIKNEIIPQYLAASDVFVLPSLSEGMGIAILEAQAAGVPVIATRVGGIIDLIEDQKTGILVEPKNSDQIAKAIIKISSEPEFAKKLVENASQNLGKYDWQNIAKKIDQIYQELIL